MPFFKFIAGFILLPSSYYIIMNVYKIVNKEIHQLDQYSILECLSYQFCRFVAALSLLIRSVISQGAERHACNFGFL